MTLMVLIGVWALAFGHISISQLKLKSGNETRIFGLAVILVAAFGLQHVNGLLFRFMPKFVAGNEAFRMSYELLIGAFCVYATGWIMTNVIPKLKIPSVTVSLKRQRAS